MEHLLIFSELTSSEIGGVLFWLFLTAILGISNFFLRAENKELKDKLEKMTSNPSIKEQPMYKHDPKKVPFNEWKRVVDENQMLKNQIKQHIENF